MHVWRWISRNFEEDQWQYIPVEAPAMVYLNYEIQLSQEAQWSFGSENTLNSTGELRGGPALRIDGEHLTIAANP